ncbi:UDP-glucuronosyltransferase 1-1 [Homalodisca vitripennis]|nr:UDP-glucuronosyltransferase 1-1 [Homalodisca vitripennis]
MRLSLLHIMLLDVISLVMGAKILAILPYSGKSHFIFVSSVLQALSQRGHHIIEYSPHPPSKPTPNYTHVEIHTGFENTIKNWTFLEFIEICRNDATNIEVLWEITYGVCLHTFQNEAVQELLDSDQHYDLVITESTFGQESMLVFGHRFGVPTVTLQGIPTWSAMNLNAGNTPSVASIADFTVIVGTDDMSFMERCKNFFYVMKILFAYYNYHLPAHEYILKTYYKYDFPPLVEMVSNVSLYLVNAHETVGYVQPYTPNIVPIAGITISPDRVPLPEEVKKFMDKAKEGVIYFSFGTMVPVHLLPENILKAFVNVFKKLKQNVLWKTDLESIPGLTNNVMLIKWVPQPGVLAHPNCVLFITHGGLFSQHEAIYAGVPIVGVPFFGDQPFNMRFAEHRGFGIKLDFHTISEDTVTAALNGVLHDPKYKNNAQRLSRIFRDRPISPADSAVFWVEHLLQHGTTQQLRPASAQLSWYQLALLDVIAVILAASAVICVVLHLVITKLWRRAFNKGTLQVDNSCEKKIKRN